MYQFFFWAECEEGLIGVGILVVKKIGGLKK